MSGIRNQDLLCYNQITEIPGNEFYCNCMILMASIGVGGILRIPL